MPSDFGAFEPVFETAHAYLALLHLAGNDAEAAVRRVRDCCRAPSAAADVEALLDDVNWRPTLVAVVAAFFLEPSASIREKLWQRFDRGSWVSPQIAVGLSMIDPDFSEQCRVRLEAHCPLESSELSSLNPIERHSAAGPAGARDRSAKAASTLGWLASRIEPQPAWLPAILAAEEHLALVASDVDSGDGIAEGWRQSITEILGRL